MIPSLLDRRLLSPVTGSLSIIRAPASAINIQILVGDGKFDPESRCVVKPLAVKALSKHHVQGGKACLSTGGISGENGLASDYPNRIVLKP